MSEDQVVLGEMPDPITRELMALPNGGSMTYYHLEADGLHTYRITKQEVFGYTDIEHNTKLAHYVPHPEQQ